MKNPFVKINFHEGVFVETMICDKCGLEMVSGQFGNHLTKECQHCEITLFLTDEGEEKTIALDCIS